MFEGVIAYETLFFAEKSVLLANMIFRNVTVLFPLNVPSLFIFGF
jgi:hypothetical protein